jgi:hypothetical protein
MTHVLILAVKILKSAIVGGLALVSWGVHAVVPPHDSPATVDANAVTIVVHANVDATAGQQVLTEKAVAEALRHARLAQRASRRIAMLRLGDLVPPIGVEQIYPPDLLLPPSALLPPTSTPPTPPLTSVSPSSSRDTSRTT